MTVPDETTGATPAPTADDVARATRRRKGLQYVAALDGLRAIAALGVVVIHTESAAGATIATYVWTGAVTGPFFMLFFAISGFVLYRGWARRHLAMGDEVAGPATARAKRGTADGGSDGRTVKYLYRRLLRIYPLYWVVATAALFASDSAGKHGILDYVQVYLLLPFPNPQALVDLGLGIVVWTLIIDVVFYVYIAGHGAVMNSVVRALRHRWSPFTVETWILWTMAVIFVVIGIFVPAPIAALACLPLGMWFAVVEAKQDRDGHRLRLVTDVLRAWPMWLFLYVFVGPLIIRIAIRASTYGELLSASPGIQVLLVLAGLLLFIIVLWGPSRWPFRRWLTSPLMRQAGLITYGMYLWHPVLLILLDRRYEVGDKNMAVYQAVTILGSIALAIVTYTLVERPLARVRGEMRETDAPAPAPARRSGADEPTRGSSGSASGGPVVDPIGPDTPAPEPT
jgi:peptidoglycan/LPS O-acetylase OafA/YrhL